MPGHFLLRDKVDPEVFVDPFHRGRLLDADGCQQLHRRLTGGGRAWDPGWLDPVGRWAIVARLLANLKAIYQQRHERDALLWVMRLRGLVPGIGPAERGEVTRLMARTTRSRRRRLDPMGHGLLQLARAIRDSIGRVLRPLRGEVIRRLATRR